jgi:hypothetical protein
MDERTRDRAAALPDGIALVTFDAGGQGNAIDPNPVIPALIEENGQTMYQIVWELRGERNTNPGWEAAVGNVVPFDAVDPLLEGLESTPGQNGRSWVWKWPKQSDGPSIPIAISYDLFFRYVPKKKDLRSVVLRTMSLRETLSVDPTLILPPKE